MASWFIYATKIGHNAQILEATWRSMEMPKRMTMMVLKGSQMSKAWRIWLALAVSRARSIRPWGKRWVVLGLGSYNLGVALEVGHLLQVASIRVQVAGVRIPALRVLLVKRRHCGGLPQFPGIFITQNKLN